MISIPEALNAILPMFTPRPVETKPTIEAVGQCVAADVIAVEDLPVFSNSAMDGYAVRAADVVSASRTSPVELQVTHEVRAGDGPPPALTGTKAAARIFTGAPLPDGADAVVMQEDTTREGDCVSILAPSVARRHVRAQGSDLARGSIALPSGQSIGPGELGLLLSQGLQTVTVHRRPTVAILATGDELREVDDPLRPGSIVNSNSHVLAQQLRTCGAIPHVLPIAPDDPAAIHQRIEEGLQFDALLTCGGVSVGDYDFGREAFERAGVELGFWKVRIKPGKPVVFGSRGDVPIVGLPGNPISAMVVFEVLVRPAIRRLLGHRHPFETLLHAQLATDYERRPGRTEFLRVQLESTPGALIAHRHSHQGSGSLPSMVGVDGLAILPEDKGNFAAGDSVSVLPLPWSTGSAASPYA